MADFHRQGEGADFTIQAGGRRWRLNLDDPQPGLAWSEGPSLARLLSLLHVSSGGRRDDRAFDRTTLLGIEHHRERIEATYAPPAWPGLSIRAAWAPSPAGDGFDLEVQISTTSSGVLPRLEIGIGSRWLDAVGDSPPRWEPRGETRQASVDHAFPPHFCREPGSSLGRYYLEMVQPNDCARRVIGEIAAQDAAVAGAFYILYDLFGHDLEKGVVLRGRIRSLWIASTAPGPEVRRQYESFLSEPPALGP